MERRIDFIIAGVQKGGTTALDAQLRRHPNIRMASIKETHFFDGNREWSNPSYEALHELFDWSDADVVRGEATPIYTYWPGCLERIRAYVRSIRLLVMLRHPSFRAFSHWRMSVTRAEESLPFDQAIRAGRERVGSFHRVYSYVERGLYARQAERLLSLFRREQILFLATDELWHDPRGQMDRITTFLGQDPFTSVPREYIVPLQSDNFGEMPPSDRACLDALFRSDIERTAELTGLDLSRWLRPEYREPMGI